MKFDNETVSQHFLSQVEQRMNAFNTNASRENMKIYSFKVIDRDNYIVSLEKQKGIKITTNLTVGDLFTFYKGSNNVRKNLEMQFRQYEDNISSLTNLLLEKTKEQEKEITDVVSNLFLSKFMNFVRNPFSIKKVLNTFGDLPDYYPTEKEILKEFKLIDSSYKPHVDYLCNKFNVTYDEYIRWIKLLFLVLMRPNGSKENILEGTIKSLMENKEFVTGFRVYKYSGEHDDKKVCLSDRSWVDSLENNADQLSMDFNITSNVFLRFYSISIKKLAPSNAPQFLIDNFIKTPRVIECRVEENDLETLRSYNRNAVLQSYERVFCSSQNIYGL